MSHLIFEIDELLRLVVDELVETSRRSAVSFALTCRFLEEPTLSSLWRKQDSLTDLIKVLPNHGWVQSGYEFESIAIERDPPAEDWVRLQRYASWMRELHLGPDGMVPSSTFSRLAENSPGGVLCTKLETLRWDVEEIPGALPFFRLFISPNLKLVSLRGSCAFDIPGVWLAGLVQIISILPTSLEGLTVIYGRGKEERLRDAISAFICRCGSSLRILRSCVPLSGPAIRRVIQLPNLRSWAVAQAPSRSIPSFPFPPLEKLRLVGQEALPWLHLLASHEEGAPQNGTAPATPCAHINGSLRSLICPENTILNSTFLSSILKFRNLVALYVGTRFPMDGCTFHLTDDDVEKLVAALPRLESLQLGVPCSLNSCNTTAASLLSISTHCPGLIALETHFNTITIVADMRRLLDGSAELDGAKCKVNNLMVARLPHEMDQEYVEVVMRGFRIIFPCLVNLTDCDGRWYEVQKICG